MTFESDQNKLIESINDAGLDGRRMPEALDDMTRQIGAEHINLWVRAPGRTRSVNDWDGIDPSFIGSYENYYAQLDPNVPLTSKWTPGTIYTDKIMVGPTVLDRSEIYQDGGRPQGIRGIALANFLRDGGLTGILGALRGPPLPTLSEVWR